MIRSSSLLLVFSFLAYAGCASQPAREPVAPAPARVADPRPPRAAEAPPPLPETRPSFGRVTVDVEDAKLDDVLREVGRQAGRGILVEGDLSALVTFSVRDAPWRDVLFFLSRVGHFQVREERKLIVCSASPKNLIHAQGAPAATCLRLVAQHAGKNVVISSRVRGTIDAYLKDVPWDQALVALADLASCVVVEEGDGPAAVHGQR